MIPIASNTTTTTPITTISIPERMTAAFPHRVFMLMKPMIKPANLHNIHYRAMAFARLNPLTRTLRMHSSQYIRFCLGLLFLMIR